MATPKAQIDLAHVVGSVMVRYLRPKNKLYEIVFVESTAEIDAETEEPILSQSYKRVICELVEAYTHNLVERYGGSHS